MKTTTLLASLLLVAAPLLGSAKVTENFSQTYPLSAVGTLSLESVNGSIEIEAWDKSEVALEAEKIAKDADELARIHLKIVSAPDSLKIKTEYDKTGGLFNRSSNGAVNYKLKVPAGISLRKIDVVNASIHVRGVKGELDLDTVNGRIAVTGAANAARLDTVNGSLSLEFDALPASGKVTLDSVNGSCTVKVPKDASFALDADNTNGSVSCDFPLTIEKKSRHTLRGQVGSGGPTLKLDSTNGSLKIVAK